MKSNGTVTAQLEKVFLHWIIKHPHFFKVVDGSYFKNDEIKFIYNAIRNEYLSSTDKIVPGIKEIKTMVRSLDAEEKIGNDLLSTILKSDPNDYRDEFIEGRFKAWLLSNSTISGLVDAIEQIKNVDRINFDEVNEKVEKVKSIINEKTTVDLGNNNIGIDFDDPDAHNQETDVYKMSSGYLCLNTMLGGGWDRKTLNVLMGQPAQGKSIWAQNFAVNAANEGYNVLYVTLELAEKKVLKRMGAMRLSIDISEYTELSKDREFIKSKIAEVNKKMTGGLFEKSPGKIFIKEFPSGSATVNDIENVVKLIHEQTGKNIDLLIVDYIQIMKAERSLQIDNMLYLKGKHLAEGLRSIGQRYNLTVLTMTQISKEKYNANDINLNDMPESKAIADTADTVFAIIRTPIMKTEGKYHLKQLKLRDSDCEYERILFNFNKRTLKIENEDHFLENMPS